MLVGHLFDVRGHHRLTVDSAAATIAAIACSASVDLPPVGVLRRDERQVDGTWADGLLTDLLAGGPPGRRPGPAPQTPVPVRQECCGS